MIQSHVPPQAPPDDRFCDLVMKGGTTSGVVYPRAIEKLSHHYRFKSIGGTSAGAIAAAVTAAAEYQRRQTGLQAGFKLLGALPIELGKPAAQGESKSKLLSLFQPQHDLRRLFSVLLSALNRGTTPSRILHIIFGVMKAYWLATLIGIVFTAIVMRDVACLYQQSIGPIYIDTGLYGFFLAIIIFIIIMPWLISPYAYFDITRRLVTHNFGLCTGMTPKNAKYEALTPWLHNLIQIAAGRTVNCEPKTSTDPKKKPLTFGDLWCADGFPPDWLKDATNTNHRSIDLQMFTTNLSHGRPYIFPLSDGNPEPTKYHDRERLYFREDEMRDYLPDDVVQWMVDNSDIYTLKKGRQGKDPEPNDSTAQELRELPRPKDFPILLAARMSLSFPFLFAAVPLHAIDSESPGKRKFRRCWFSDGGISSNFPMHLFDGLVPRWPTFGLTLEPEIIGRGMVFVPEKYDQGYGERWNPIPEENQGARKLGCFISSIISTMQNWNDNSLARMPGVRDRVARVRLQNGEGGMNLNMAASLIQKVSEKGINAVDALLDRFATQHRNGKNINGWDEHRFVRLNVLRKMLEARSPDVLAAVNPHCKHAFDFTTLLKDMMSLKDENGAPLPPPGYEQPMTMAQCQETKNFVTALQQLATYIANPKAPIPFKPIPSPELRVRPPL